MKSSRVPADPSPDIALTSDDDPGQPGRPGSSRVVQGATADDPGRGTGCVRRTPRPGSAAPSLRILPGRHEDDCDGAGCEGCQPCPETHCTTCRREHADCTCPGCLAMARLNLALIQELVGHLPTHAVLGRQAWHEHDGLLGGDATVMLTPASPHWLEGHTRPVTTDQPNDVRPPLDVLASWVNRWHVRIDSRILPTHDLGWCVDHLDSQLHAIGQTPMFTPMARDLARLRYSLENVLHAGDRPDVSRVPCWDCGTRLHKVWTDDQNHDYHRCPVCGQTFDHLRYTACRHFQLASRGADRYVALADAVAVTGRPEQTVRAWARDGLVDSRRVSGHVEVWWPDVRDRDQATPHRRRLAR